MYVFQYLKAYARIKVKTSPTGIVSCTPYPWPEHTQTRYMTSQPVSVAAEVKQEVCHRNPIQETWSPKSCSGVPKTSARRHWFQYQMIFVNNRSTQATYVPPLQFPAQRVHQSFQHRHSAHSAIRRYNGHQKELEIALSFSHNFAYILTSNCKHSSTW